MRQVLCLLLACLVLRLFFPDVAASLERVMLSLLDLASQVLTLAAASSGRL